AAERRLMQDQLDAVARGLAVGELTDVAANELEARPLLGAQCSLDFVEVTLVSRGEIVEPDHALIEREQGLEQVRPDEAGGAGDEPSARRRTQLGLQRLVAHQSLQ